MKILKYFDVTIDSPDLPYTPILYNPKSHDKPTLLSPKLLEPFGKRSIDASKAGKQVLIKGTSFPIK